MNLYMDKGNKNKTILEENKARPVVLVTGAARRVGRAICQRLFDDGCRIALHYHDSETAAQELAEMLEAKRSGDCLLLKADLKSEQEVSSMVPSVLDAFGRLDGLVNNASIFYPNDISQPLATHWQKFMDIHAFSPMLLIQSAMDALSKSKGSVVNITDIYAKKPLKGYPIYSLSKSTLDASTKVLALELGEYGIRVNAVAPGSVLLPENRPDFDDAKIEQIHRQTPLKVEVDGPLEVAKAVRFLLREALYITGAVLPVDGGRRLAIGDDT